MAKKTNWNCTNCTDFEVCEHKESVMHSIGFCVEYAPCDDPSIVYVAPPKDDSRNLHLEPDWKAESKVLEARLSHLLQSKTVQLFDEHDPVTGEYARDIRRLDSYGVNLKILEHDRQQTTHTPEYRKPSPPPPPPSPKFVDPVNHPGHYESGKFECIEVMIETQGKEAVMDFCICNAFKYIYRHKRKNGMEDILKAQWYLDKFVELAKSEEVQGDG